LQPKRQRAERLGLLDLLPDDADPDVELAAEDYVPDRYREFDDDFDVVGMIESSYDEDTQTVRDLKIDDRDLPRAKNYFDFCSNYMGKTARMPFSRQMWLGVTLLNEVCPRCSDPKWANIMGVPVDYKTKDMPEHLTFLELGKCPKCGVTKSELARKGEINVYTELDACCGQRAGKSTVTASLSAYHLHCYLKLPHLSSICEGIQDSTPLTGTFVGLRFADAFNLLWTPIVEIIDASEWYGEYHQLLEHYSEQYNKELLKKRDVFIRYGHKNIELYPSGPTKRGLRGRTRFIAATDELGWFPVDLKATTEDNESDSERERANADEVHTALDRSLLTVRTEVHELIHKKKYSSVPTGLQICVSSPASRKDKIWRLIQANKNSKLALAIHLPTWEMSPRYPRNHPQIQAAYDSNPTKAERDYGAIPPKSVMTFIEDTTISKCFTGTQGASIERASATIHGKKYIAAKVSNVKTGNDMQPAIMAIDAGYSNNAFGVVIGYREGLQLVVPVALEIQPKPDTVLHYNAIYKGVLVPLANAFNVRYLFADRWQSIALLHRAQDELGVDASMYSVKYNDFALLKSKMCEGELTLPKIEEIVPDDVAVTNYPNGFSGKPAAHLLFQALTVKEVGRSITKGDGYTDDLFRALALLTAKAFDPKVVEKLAKMTSKKRAAKAVSSILSRGSLVGPHNSLLSGTGGYQSKQIVIRSRH
jgi:ribosomal protein S27AE